MNTLNRVQLIGYVEKQPECTQKDGVTIVKFNIGTNALWTNKALKHRKRTDWHAVVLYGSEADSAVAHLTKGSYVLFEGQMRQRTFIHYGETLFATEVVGDRVRFLDREGSVNRKEDLAKLKINAELESQA